MAQVETVTSSFWEFKGQGDYVDRKFLMSSPFPVVSILAAYLWFVLKFGPEFMKNRKPYNLDKVLVVYNFAQVIFSTALVSAGVPGATDFGLYHSNCHCHNEHLGRRIADGAHLYFVAKIVELLDTVFFVLRKKQNQVTFLHVYHHTLMAFATWCTVKYSITDSIVFIGGINSVVHIVMYSYYALSVFPSLVPYLWWKKYITIMQLVQFCLMFLHMVISNYVSECKPNYVLMLAICANTIIFFYLFGDFYIKSYTKNKKAKLEAEEAKLQQNAEKLSPNNVSEKSGKNNLNYLIRPACYSRG